MFDGYRFGKKVFTSEAARDSYLEMFPYLKGNVVETDGPKGPEIIVDSDKIRTGSVEGDYDRSHQLTYINYDRAGNKLIRSTSHGDTVASMYRFQEEW